MKLHVKFERQHEPLSFACDVIYVRPGKLSFANTDGVRMEATQAGNGWLVPGMGTFDFVVIKAGT